MPSKSAHHQNPLRRRWDPHNGQTCRGKGWPRSLTSCTPLSLYVSFPCPISQGQGTQTKTFCRLCGRLCCTRIGHRLTPHPKTKGFEGLSCVSSCGKPVGKGQNERRMLHSAVTEEYLSLFTGKEKGLLLLGIINQWVWGIRPAPFLKLWS